MSSSNRESVSEGTSRSSQTNPQDAHIPRRSQLARFQRESPRDGNALVSLLDNTRDVKTAVYHHKARASHAIKLFQQKFGKDPVQPSPELAQQERDSSGSPDEDRRSK